MTGARLESKSCIDKQIVPSDGHLNIKQSVQDKSCGFLNLVTICLEFKNLFSFFLITAADCPDLEILP